MHVRGRLSVGMMLSSTILQVYGTGDCKGMWYESTCSFMGIWSRTFSMQKGDNKKSRKP